MSTLNTIQEAIVQQNPARGFSKHGHTERMGTNASILFEHPAMAIDSVAKSLVAGGWISIRVVYTLLAIGNRTLTDLRMGGLFG